MMHAVQIDFAMEKCIAKCSVLQMLHYVKVVHGVRSAKLNFEKFSCALYAAKSIWRVSVGIVRNSMHVNIPENGKILK
jgi:hypothetical protein